MVRDGSVTRLIQLLRSDDAAERNVAARLIWRRYFHDLLELARNNLNKRIRHREDEEDVLQSMYKSFCLRQQRGEFDLAGRDALWKLLVTITLRKARNAANRHARDKRDVTREQTLADHDGAGSAHWALEQMDAVGPSPAEAALLNEALERRLEALADPRSAADRALAAGGLHQPRDRRPARLHRALGRTAAGADPQQVDVVRRRHESESLLIARSARGGRHERDPHLGLDADQRRRGSLRTGLEGRAKARASRTIWPT